MLLLAGVPPGERKPEDREQSEEVHADDGAGHVAEPEETQRDPDAPGRRLFGEHGGE